MKILTRDFIFIFVVNLIIFLGFQMYPSVLPLYVSELGADASVIGWVTAITTFATLLTRPISGLVNDRYGRRGILIVGLVCLSIVSASYAFFPIIGIILAIRFLHGIAWGITSTSTSTIAADVINPKRFGEGMGYFSMSTGISLAIAPAASLYIFQYFGMTPIVVIATSFTLLAILLSLFLKTLPVEKSEQKKDVKFSELFEKKAILSAFVIFLLNCCFGAIMTFIALHGQKIGVNDVWVYFVVYAVLALIIRPLIGRIIDKSGFTIPNIVGCLCIAAALVTVCFSNSVFMFALAGAFSGIGFGIAMTTLQTMAVSAVPPLRRGVATSTYFFGFDAGIGVGAIIAGLIAGFTGYALMFVTFTILPIIAICVFLIAMRYNKNKVN